MTTREKEVYLALHGVTKIQIADESVYNIGIENFYMNLDEAFDFKANNIMPMQKITSRLGYILYGKRNRINDK